MTFTIAPLIGAVAPFDIGFDSHRGTIIWAVVSLAVVVATVNLGARHDDALDAVQPADRDDRHLPVRAQIVLSSGAWIAG